jgi:hypothetical protein
MTDIREFDFRYNWTCDVLTALDRAIDGIDPDADGLDQLETGESIIGIGFIALQTYIAGATADVAAVFRGCCRKAYDLRAMESPSVARSGVRVVEAIWAAANYAKHHDEWPDWQPHGPREPTIQTLGLLGISKSTEFPCVEVLELLPPPGEHHLLPLLESVSGWREALFTAMRSP